VPPRWDGITVDPAIVNGDAVSERCDSLYDESSRRRVCMPRRRLCAAALLQPPGNRSVCALFRTLRRLQHGEGGSPLPIPGAGITRILLGNRYGDPEPTIGHCVGEHQLITDSLGHRHPPTSSSSDAVHVDTFPRTEFPLNSHEPQRSKYDPQIHCERLHKPYTFNF
jgi:hypothetical protein